MSHLLPQGSSSVSASDIVSGNEAANDTLGGWLMVAQSITATPRDGDQWKLWADTMVTIELPQDIFSLSDIGQLYAWRVLRMLVAARVWFALTYKGITWSVHVAGSQMQVLKDAGVRGYDEVQEAERLRGVTNKP